MPSHFHPRSMMTTSLFGTTLAVSFLVVGMPHLFPCPAPRASYADTEVLEDGRRVRRRRREDGEGTSGKDTSALTRAERREAEEDSVLEVLEPSKGRECPVPKPKVVVGSLLSWRKGREEEEKEDRSGKS